VADTILVVDDEAHIRSLLIGFLTGEGYEVVAASDGEEALSVAQSEDLQLVLLDIRMPGIDGVETCKKLKANEKTRLIPVIIITGYQDSKMEVLEAGAEDFVNKPFDMVELAIRVKSILRIRHLENELKRTVAYISELQKDLPRL
jgi:putative two-component system response regulator